MFQVDFIFFCISDDWLSSRCASHVFTEGALSHAVDWAALSTPNKGMLRGDGSSGRGYTTGEESGMGEGGGGMAWGGVENGVAEAYAKYAEHTVTSITKHFPKQMSTISIVQRFVVLCGEV